MPTIRLVPSAYTRSNTSKVTVTNPGNMYYNTDHTSNYCTIQGYTSTSNTYYAFIHGFNFGDIPSNAIINSFSIKIRAYRNSYFSTGSTYRLRLASSPSNSSAISNTTLSSDVTITSGGTVYTFPNGSLTWRDLTNYGSNFSIEIPLRPSRNQRPILYVYGAEIEVDYSLPYTIAVSSSAGSGGCIVSGDGEVAGGSNTTLTFTALDSGYIIDSLTDNGNDVTNDVVPIGGDQFTYTINNVQEDHALVVHFRAPSYDVTSTSSGQGSISPSGTSTLNPGDSYTLTMTPNDFNSIGVTLSDNGNDVSSQIVESGNSYTYTINNINSDHTLIATFGTAYQITTSVNGGGTITPGRKVVQGASYELTITPNFPNDAIVTLTDNGNDVTSSLVNHTTYYTYTITNVRAAHNLVVHIESPLAIVINTDVNLFLTIGSTTTTYYANQSPITVQVARDTDVVLKINNGQGSTSSTTHAEVYLNNINITQQGYYDRSSSSNSNPSYNIDNIQSDQNIRIETVQSQSVTLTLTKSGRQYGNFYDTNRNLISSNTVTLKEGQYFSFYIKDVYDTIDTSVTPNKINGIISFTFNGEPIKWSDSYYKWRRITGYYYYETQAIWNDSEIVLDTGDITNWKKVKVSSSIASYDGSINMLGVYPNLDPDQNFNVDNVLWFDYSNYAFFISNEQYLLAKAEILLYSYPDPQDPQPIYPVDDLMIVNKFKYNENDSYTTDKTTVFQPQSDRNHFQCYCYASMHQSQYIWWQVTTDNKETWSITTTLNGNGTISNGTTKSKNSYSSYTLTITPANMSDYIVVTDNYHDITDSLTKKSSNYTYSISNINYHHNFVATLSETRGYNITNNISGKGTISNNVFIEEGDPTTITITPTYPSQSTVTATDNGNNITSLLVHSGNDYLYTINSVNEDHTINATITLPTYNITNSVVGDGTISSNIVAEYGDTKTITITPTNISFSRVSLIDNNVDVSSSLVNTGSTYTYQLSNITTNHTIVATITTVSSYQITTSISGNGTITPSTQVAEGSNFQVTITPYNMEVMIVLLDNNIDMSNYVINTGSTYTYTIQNIQEAHTISATVTNLPTIDDWHVKIPNQTRDVNVNGTWVSVDTPYYKLNGSWITPEKVYYKYSGNWILVWPKNPPLPSYLLFAADFTSDLSYTSYIDGGSTGTFTKDPNVSITSASYDSDGLQVPAYNTNFCIGTVIPAALDSFLHTSGQEVWFTMRAKVIQDSAGSSSYSSGCDYGWGTNTSYPYQRNDTAHNFFSINGEYYKNRSGEPYVPAGTTVWLKTQYTSAGAFIQRVFSYSTWTGANAYSNPGTWQQNFSNTTSSKAIWNNANHHTMGFHHGLQIIKIRDFKIWSSEPTNTEIGI